MTTKFQSFPANVIVPEPGQLVCAIEPSDPSFHGSLRVAVILTSSSSGLSKDLAPGTRILIAEDSGRRFMLDDQPFVLLHRSSVLATLRTEDAIDPGMPGLR